MARSFDFGQNSGKAHRTLPSTHISFLSDISCPQYFGIYLNEFNLTGQMLGVRFAHLRYRFLVEHSAGAPVTEMLPAVNELCIKSPRQPVGSIGQRAFGLEEL